jgi:8-oxo-dGTP pyrophosphatase MutT (NUDIX family)
MQTIVVDAKKRSAGVLILSGQRFLLLERGSGVRNAGLWDLPGGQQIKTESGYATAAREAVEELFELPEHQIVGAIAVQRGARRYEVFACRVRKRLRKTWAPTLDQEHTAFYWASLDWCGARLRALHPVVRTLVHHEVGRRWLAQMLATRVRSYPGGRRSSDGCIPLR